MKSGVAGLLALAGWVAVLTIGPACAVPKVVLEKPVQIAHVDLAVSLDAEGRATAVHAAPGWAPATVTERLIELTRPITFRSSDPLPPAVRLRFTLATEAMPNGQVALRVEHVLVAKPDPVPALQAASDPASDAVARVTLTPLERPEPRFPPKLAKLGVEGDVLLAVQVGPDGVVRDAKVVQSALRNVRGSLNGIAGLVAEMEEAAVQGVQRWTYRVSVPKGADAGDSDLRGFLRISFRIVPRLNADGIAARSASIPEEARAGTTWLTLVRTAYHAPAWSAKDEPGAIDIVDFDSGDWYPLTWFDIQPSNDLTDTRL